MFGIKHNAVWLNLKEDAVLSTTQYSQIINESKLRGAFTIPLDVPIATNENFFENRFHLKSMNVTGPITFDQVQIYVEGVWWLTGKIIVQRVSEEMLSADLVVGLPGITSLEKKLQDLSWSTIALSTDPNPWVQLAAKMDVFNNQLTEDYDPNDSTKSFNFPLIKNGTYYGQDNEKNPDYLGIMNNYDEQNGDGFIDNKYGNWNAIVPMVYKLEILRKGFTDGGYIFDYSNLPSSFTKLIQPSNYDLCKLRSAFKVNAQISSSFTCNGTGLGGVAGAGIDFDTITQDDFLQMDTGVAGAYQIKRNGKHEGIIHVEWSAPGPTALWTGELWLQVFVPTTVASFQFFVGNILAANIDDIKFYIDISDDDKTLTFTCSSPGFPNVTGSFTLSSGTYIDKGFFVAPYFLDSGDPSGTVNATITACTIQIANLSHPLVNHFPNSIELKNCVPQDILFKNYVNAFASTHNVDFIVDANFKTVTAKLNETDVAAEPIHQEELYQSNSTAPIIEFRPAKYNKLAYRFDGSDQLLSNNFKTVDPADDIGEYGSFQDLNLNVPPDVTWLKKKSRVWNEVRWYECGINKDTTLPEWLFFTDDYAPYSVGNGENTLEMPISPLLMSHHSFQNFTMAVPVMELEANSPGFNLNNKDIGLRMIYFSGLCEFPLEIGGATNMPYSTPTTYQFKRAGDAFWSVVGNSLEYYREVAGINKGIYSNWKVTIRTLNMIRKLIKKFNMSMWQLINWSFRNRVYMGGAVLMPEQLSIATSKTTTGLDIEMELGIEEVIVE